MKINDELKELIENNAIALSTVDSKGNPHIIAVGFCKVVEGKIIITDNYMNETPKNIEKNNNIALAVWSRNWEEKCRGFEIKGTAEYFTEGKWRDFVKGLPENKNYPAKAAIVVSVQKIKELA